MKPTLQLTLRGALTLTPQLQQSIRLLQLSTVELNAEVEHMLRENPLLEKAEGDDEPPPTTSQVAGVGASALEAPSTHDDDRAGGREAGDERAQRRRRSTAPISRTTPAVSRTGAGALRPTTMTRVSIRSRSRPARCATTCSPSSPCSI